MKLQSIVTTALLAAASLLPFSSPVSALPAAVCGNGQHVGNPHCRQDGGNITATLDALGHTCDISVDDYNIDLIPGSGGTASASDNAAFTVSQSSDTTWSVETLSETGPTNLSAANITVGLGGETLEATLSGGESAEVDGELDEESVSVSASMTASNGGFASGQYQVGTVLTCVQN